MPYARSSSKETNMRKAIIGIAVFVSLLCSGCVLDYTTIGMCFTPNSGVNCGSTIDPHTPPELPLPDPYVGFKVQTAVWDARAPIRQAIYDADSILITGQFVGNGTSIPSQGAVMSIDDFTAPITSPLPGIYFCTSCAVPG